MWEKKEERFCVRVGVCCVRASSRGAQTLPAPSPPSLDTGESPWSLSLSPSLPPSLVSSSVSARAGLRAHEGLHEVQEVDDEDDDDEVGVAEDLVSGLLLLLPLERAAGPGLVGVAAAAAAAPRRSLARDVFVAVAAAAAAAASVASPAAPSAPAGRRRAGVHNLKEMLEEKRRCARSRARRVEAARSAAYSQRPAARIAHCIVWQGCQGQWRP